jgi:hypothetical protein
MTKQATSTTVTAAMPADFQSFLDAILTAKGCGTYADAWAAFEKSILPADHVKAMTAK